MEKMILPYDGKERVLVLNSLEEGLKVTIFPQYSSGRMVRSANLILTGVAKGDSGSHMVGLVEGDVNDSRGAKVLVNLDLCTSAQQKLVDVPTDIKSKIDSYSDLADKEELTEEEQEQVAKLVTELKYYFGAERSLGL